MNDTTNEAAAAAPTPAPTEIETLKAQLAEAQDKALRATAELDNVRKRAEREVSGAYKYALERALGDLLPVADSLEQGLKIAAASQDDRQDGGSAARGMDAGAAKAILDGMALTQKQLLTFLEKHGVKIIDPQGQPFTADKHEAVSMVESSEVPANHVLSVMQKGYSLHERLLRPAMVMVAKEPSKPSANG